MTIIERLQQLKDLEPHKIALVVDDEQYTYGELYDAILSSDINTISRTVELTLAKEAVKNKVLLIQNQSFIEQLVQWLSSLYKGDIPMVCHNEMDTDYIDELACVIKSDGVPLSADFGVLTSGTTGRPKPLWRSESSWRDFFDIQNNIFHIKKIQKSFYMVVLASLVLVIWLSPCYGLVELLLQRVRCVPIDGSSLLRNIMWTIYMHYQQNYDY